MASVVENDMTGPSEAVFQWTDYANANWQWSFDHVYNGPFLTECQVATHKKSNYPNCLSVYVCIYIH